MSELQDSIEPLELPVVPDVPRSGAAHGDRSRKRQAAAQPPGAGENRSVAPVSRDTVAERRTSEAGTGFRGRVHALSVGYYRAEAGAPSLVADPVKPAPCWAELSATTPLSRAPVHMADESFCRELEAVVLDELNGGGSAGDDELEWERRRSRRPSSDAWRARRRPSRRGTRDRCARTD
jgi:hypothetical protein